MNHAAFICLDYVGECLCVCVSIYLCVFILPLRASERKLFQKATSESSWDSFSYTQGNLIHPTQGREIFPVQRDLPSAPPAGKSSFSDPNGPDPFLSPWPSSTSRSLVDGSLLIPANPAGQLMCRVTMDTVTKVSESYFQGLQNERKWFLPCRTVKLR